MKLSYKIRQALLAKAPKCDWCNLQLKAGIDGVHEEVDGDGGQLKFHPECWKAMLKEAKDKVLKLKRKRK